MHKQEYRRTGHIIFGGGQHTKHHYRREHIGKKQSRINSTKSSEQANRGDNRQQEKKNRGQEKGKKQKEKDRTKNRTQATKKAEKEEKTGEIGFILTYIVSLTHVSPRPSPAHAGSPCYSSALAVTPLSGFCPTVLFTPPHRCLVCYFHRFSRLTTPLPNICPTPILTPPPRCVGGFSPPPLGAPWYSSRFFPSRLFSPSCPWPALRLRPSLSLLGRRVSTSSRVFPPFPVMIRLMRLMVRTRTRREHRTRPAVRPPVHCPRHGPLSSRVLHSWHHS